MEKLTSGNLPCRKRHQGDAETRIAQKGSGRHAVFQGLESGLEQTYGNLRRYSKVSGFGHLPKDCQRSQQPDKTSPTLRKTRIRQQMVVRLLHVHQQDPPPAHVADDLHQSRLLAASMPAVVVLLLGELADRFAGELLE